MGPEQKLCVACFTSIDKRARKCPACRQQQGYRDTILIGVGLAILAITGGCAVCVSLMQMNRMSRQKTPSVVVEYKRPIDIVSSRLVFVERQTCFDSTSVAVVGKMRNNGTQPLFHIECCVRIYDRSDALLETFCSIVSRQVEPGSDVAFKLLDFRGGLNARRKDYARHVVVVVKADR